MSKMGKHNVRQVSSSLLVGSINNKNCVWQTGPLPHSVNRHVMASTYPKSCTAQPIQSLNSIYTVAISETKIILPYPAQSRAHHLEGTQVKHLILCSSFEDELASWISMFPLSIMIIKPQVNQPWCLLAKTHTMHISEPLIMRYVQQIAATAARQSWLWLRGLVQVPTRQDDKSNTVRHLS